MTLVALITRHPAPLAVLLLLLLPRMTGPRWPVLLIAASGFVMNGLFSWHGATELWRAPFTLDLVGRPRLTLEAMASGLTTGLQIGVAAFALMWGFAGTPPHAVARLVPGRSARIATLLGLRAVPELRRDATAMHHALAVRGIEARGVRGAGHVLVPLTARSLDRASDALEGMHARGMDAPARPAVPLRAGAMGWTSLAAIALLLLAAATGTLPAASYFPALGLGAVTAWTTWTPLVAALPLLFDLRPARADAQAAQEVLA